MRILSLIVGLGVLAAMAVFNYKTSDQLNAISSYAKELSTLTNLRGRQRFLSASHLTHFNNVDQPLSPAQWRQLQELQQQLRGQNLPYVGTLPAGLEAPPEWYTSRSSVQSQIDTLMAWAPSMVGLTQRAVLQWHEKFIAEVDALQSHNADLNTMIILVLKQRTRASIWLNYAGVLAGGMICWFIYIGARKRLRHQLKTLEEKNEQMQNVQQLMLSQAEDLRMESEQLADARARQHTINQLLPVGLMVVDKQGQITEVNQESCRLFGYSEDELLAMTVEQLVPDASRSGHAQLRKSFGADAKPRMMAANNATLAGQRKDGGLMPLEIGLAQVSLGGKPFVIATLLDVEERRRALEQLQEKNVQMDLALDKLSQSNEQLERFAFICSHDLQEPVRMVLSFSQLLEKNAVAQLDDKALGYLKHITDGATRAREMVSDILTFCRLDQNTDAHQTIGLPLICEQVQTTLKPTLEERNAAFYWDADLPSVEGVPSQLFQLLMNLVSNGIKFNRSVQPEVRVSAADQASGWRIVVADNGIGIEPQYIHKLFQIFARLNAKTEFPGTGIGLAICKKIVEQHGATITIESEPDEGSRFIIDWPKAVELAASAG